MDIEIQIIKEVRKKEMIRLYRDAGWWQADWEQDTSFLEGIVKNSALFAAAFHDGAMVGMGRALSDRVSDAYIQDVAVLKGYRNQGIGKRIIQALVSNLKKSGVDWIGLISEPGTQDFYTRLGFEELKGHVAYKLTNPN
ncbi:MAG: N-acetyltransferase [Desulfobacteraceae bacterium]|nr:MAG: N-acetyltransferase [Desulfobacteraceae bacterium]